MRIREPHASAAIRILIVLLLQIALASTLHAEIAFGCGSLGAGSNDYVAPDAAGRRADVLKQTMGGRALRVGCASVKYIDSTIGDPSAEIANSDKVVLAAARGRFATMYLVECYYQPGDGRFDLTPDRYDWYGVGRRIANRYRPGSAWLASQGITDWGIEVYEAFNEPNVPCYGQFVDTAIYRKALRDFARGIHSVSPSLKAIPGATYGDYLKAIAGLLNSDTLNGVDLHLYASKIGYQGAYTAHGQGTFDWAKGVFGITADIDLYVSETNFWKSDTTQTQDDAARDALTTWWACIGVTGTSGQPKCRMTLTWNPWNLYDPSHTSGWDWMEEVCLPMCDGSRDPWKGNERGRVFQMMLWLTKGMDVVSSDIKMDKPGGCAGETVCAGGGRRLWVWHNRADHTNHAGTTYTVTGIPSGSTKIEVFRYNSWTQTAAGDTGTPLPYRTVAVSGRTSVTIDNLPTEETLMFLASSGTSSARSVYDPSQKIPGRAFRMRKPETMEVLSLDGRVIARAVPNHSRLTEGNPALPAPGAYLERRNDTVSSSPRVIIIDR